MKQNVSENEISWMLDHLLDFSDNDKVLGLYQHVCETFEEKYPDLIEAYRGYLRESWEE